MKFHSSQRSSRYSNPRRPFNRSRRSYPGGSSTPPKNAEEELFLSKTSIDPTKRLRLEDGSSEISMRVIDLICPIGKGQRGLIVSPPKAGKTTLLKQICQSLAKCDPTLKLYCLLIDERPEEVTDFKRSVTAEVHASSSDRRYEEHIQVAQNLMRRAIQEVNAKHDVVILLDSLTRLSRVHNQNTVGNKTMSGGLDSRALEIPRRFFGAARNLEEGGSLTILATILVETGSRMDDVIFQEFKGTGNMELVLSRQIAEQRIFPAVNIRASGTRKEERLLEAEELQKIYKLRRALAGLEDVQAASVLVELLQQYPTNSAALKTVE